MLTVRIPIANPEALLTTWGAGALARLESSATETGVYTEVGTAALVAGLYEYYVVDAVGTSAMWYRWRPSIAAPAAPADYGAYSDPWVPGGPYLTVDQFRAFPDMPSATVLPDEQLLILLTSAAQEIVRAVGSGGSQSEHIHVHGELLPLSYPALSITTVVERDVTLDATDYTVTGTGQALRRLHTGTNPAYRWCGPVDVTYLPVDDTATRQRVQLELVKLAIAFSPGLASQQIGTWTETYTTSGQTYSQQRAEILATLSDGAYIG